MAITDPAILAGELERLRQHYNSVRLHEAIGYVTPNDEHEGRGDAIRAARITGLESPTNNADTGTGPTRTFPPAVQAQSSSGPAAALPTTGPDEFRSALTNVMAGYRQPDGTNRLDSVFR